MRQITISPRVKTALEQAFHASRELGHSYVGPEHILIEGELTAAVTDVLGGQGGRIFARFGDRAGHQAHRRDRDAVAQVDVADDAGAAADQAVAADPRAAEHRHVFENVIPRNCASNAPAALEVGPVFLQRPRQAHDDGAAAQDAEEEERPVDADLGQARTDDGRPAPSEGRSTDGREALQRGGPFR